MKIINKYFRVLVVFFFILSSTGIPLVVHTCKAMQKITMESCMMDDMNTEQNSNSQSKIVNDCCRDQLIAEHLDSKYISTNDHKNETAESGYVLQVLNDYHIIENFIEINFLYVNSPPVNQSASIFITNHELLI